jgi:hypothetical protein
MFSVHKFEISERNMYVRRFLPTYMYGGKSLPAKEINRYRNKIAVAYPLAIKGHIWKPFASYEAFYDQGSGWTRNRAWTGITVPSTSMCRFSRPTCGKTQTESKTSAT